MDTRDRVWALVFLHLCIIRPLQSQVAGTGTVIDVLQSTQGLGKFADLFRKSNLDDQFNEQTKFTMFAPNNTAFENLPQRIRDTINGWKESSYELREYIYFHSILDTKLLTSDMHDNAVYESRAPNGNKLFINRRTQTAGSSGFFGPTVYFVNGARISSTQRDLVATNGVVQGLDTCITMTSNEKVLSYIYKPSDDTIHTSEFYNLVNYLRGIYVNTKDELSSRNRITVFVPNNDAMNKIPPSKLSELRENPQELDRVIRAHIIYDRVVFTSYSNHNEGFRNAVSNNKYTRIRKPTPNKIYVNSEGVDAQILLGNVTVSNGVIHIIDTLLGYVYNNVREIIQTPSNNASTFEQLLNRGSEEMRNSLVQQSGVNVFVPVNSAFDQLYNVPGIDLSDNQLVDRVLRLHILDSFQDVEVSTIIGGYESRVYKKTKYYSTELTVYTERNETWVQGGFVKAGIIRPDLSATNGRVQMIDAVMGIPYLDIPMLICHDLWLLRTYDSIKSVGMKTFLTDDRFSAKKCDFERFGYPPGYDYGSNTYTTNQINQNIGQQTSRYDMGRCSGCMFTFFVPNSTAINALQKDRVGAEIMKDMYKFQRIFKRLLFDDRIVLEELPNGYNTYQSRTGERVGVLKSNDRNVQIQFKTKRANVIHMDQGATNGLVHIIDNILFTNDDLIFSGAPSIRVSFVLLTIILCCFCRRMLT